MHADARRRITLYYQKQVSLQGTGFEPLGLGPSSSVENRNSESLAVACLPGYQREKWEPLGCLRNAGSYFAITYCTPVTVPPSSLQTTPECPVILSGAQSRVLHLLGLIMEVRRGRGSRGSSLVVEMDPPAPAVVPKLCLFPSSGQMPALGGRGVQMFLLCDRCVVYVRSILQSAPYC